MLSSLTDNGGYGDMVRMEGKLRARQRRSSTNWPSVLMLAPALGMHRTTIALTSGNGHALKGAIRRPEEIEDEHYHRECGQWQKA